MTRRYREELERWFRMALEAVDPVRALRSHVSRKGEALQIADLPIPANSKLVVLSVGKAAVAMADALAARVGDRVADALIVTVDGVDPGATDWRLCRAGHPLPDARSEMAASAALDLVERADPNDVLVVLLSGGASALLTAPAEGLGLEQIAATTAGLLAAGAPVDELNAVRKHLSAINGGRLAARARCGRVVQLVISDVLGDRSDVIGSGPCVADPTTFRDALAVLERRDQIRETPAAVLDHLRAGSQGRREESPKPGDPKLDRVYTEIIARNRDAMTAVCDAAREADVRPVWVTDALQGEARVAGQRIAALLRAENGARGLLLAGGETTVTVRGSGRGGRNQELALAAAIEFAGVPSVTLLAAGTDGIDGPTDAAGAFADGETLARATALGLDPQKALGENDSHGFFRAEGGLLRTGPTGTNVMDLVLARFGP